MPSPVASERVPLKLEGAVILTTKEIEILNRAERGELDCPRCESRLHGEPVDLGEEATTMLFCFGCGFREL